MQLTVRVKTLVLAAASMIGVAPANDYALEFGPGAFVEFPHHAIMHTGATATVEGWLRAMDAGDGEFRLFERYLGSQEHKGLNVLPNGRIHWLYAGSPWAHSPSPCVDTDPGAFPFDGDFHHVAFVRRADATWEVYLDGHSIVTGGPGSGLGNCCWVTCNVIEATTSTVMGLFPATTGSWQVASMRVSAVERYTNDFTPQADWVADPDTAMLLALNEGTGNLALDSGPAGQIGSISGQYTWVPIDTQIGSPYCPANLNSSGFPGSVHAFGSTTITENELTLQADSLPMNQYGYFLMSAHQDFVPLFGGSQGNLCLGLPIIRFNTEPQHILFSGTTGAMIFPVDLTDMPQTTVFLPGDTWNFQCWFRDVDGTSFTSNTTDAVSITWQ